MGCASRPSDTPSWGGRAVLHEIDATMSNERLGSPPFPQWQVYSSEWNGYLAVRQAGPYTFWVSSDDGSSLEVDGTTVVDNGGVHAAQPASGQRELSEGIHPIRVRYFQGGGRYSLSVMWSHDGRIFEPAPPNQLLPDRASYTWYRLRAFLPIAVTLTALLCAQMTRRSGPTRRPPRRGFVERWCGTSRRPSFR